MTKVTIPREVAEEIEHLRSGVGYGKTRDNAQICEIALRTGGGIHPATHILRKIPFDTLLSALVNGYGRELTAEETIADIYRKLTESANMERGIYNGDSSRYTMAALAIERTLGLLGVIIPGVNDTEVNV